MLLSFWDYLRRKTAESVLLGIQDALTVADRPSTEAHVGELSIQLDLQPPAEPTPQTGHLEHTNTPAPSSNVPAPRRRGRPRIHPKTP